MSSHAPAPVLDTKRGKQILMLLLAVAFLDFVDASIVNVALPSIRADLGFTVRNLQWVLTGYLLTYGGLMLLGGRASDLFGRRRLLVAGTVLFARLVARRGRRARRHRADRRPHDPGRRRGDDDPRRALDPDHDVQRSPATATRHWALGARSAGSHPRSACSWAASSPTSSTGGGCSS